MGKQSKKVTVPIFAILLAVAIVLMFVMALFRKPIETEVVRYGTAENKKSVEAYILRNEYIINSPESGILNCHVAENARVPRYTKIASVYVGEYSEDMQIKLRNINEKINQLETSAKDKSFYVTDTASTEKTIHTRVDSILSSVYKNDMSHAAQYKDDLNKLIKNLNGEQVNETDTLSQLKQQKIEIEKQLSATVSDIYSPVSGVFNSTIDGYEEYFKTSNIQRITPEYLNNADSAKSNVSQNAVKDTPVAKISNNYEWYVASILDAIWADNLKTGNLVNLRFPKISENTYSGVIKHISPEENGKVAVVVSCGEYVDNIFGVRKVDAEIIKATYNGFKISKDAVRILEDGSQGVYVLRNGTAWFRNIDVLYNGESYIIAREDNSKASNVLLYDEVILGKDNLFDGMVVE